MRGGLGAPFNLNDLEEAPPPRCPPSPSLSSSLARGWCPVPLKAGPSHLDLHSPALGLSAGPSPVPAGASCPSPDEAGLGLHCGHHTGLRLSGLQAGPGGRVTHSAITLEASRNGVLKPCAPRRPPHLETAPPPAHLAALKGGRRLAACVGLAPPRPEWAPPHMCAHACRAGAGCGLTGHSCSGRRGPRPAGAGGCSCGIGPAARSCPSSTRWPGRAHDRSAPRSGRDEGGLGVGSAGRGRGSASGERECRPG